MLECESMCYPAGSSVLSSCAAVYMKAMTSASKLLVI